MKRIDTQDGRFAAGDPTIRKPGTIVTSTWMNALQDEICHVIEQAGLTLDDNDQTQLRAAIANMINAEITTHKHVIADVNGLQAALNGKLNNTGGTLTNNLTVKGFYIAQATDSKNPVLFLRDAEGNNRGNVFWDRNNGKVRISRYDPDTGTTAGWLSINANNTVQTSHAITAPGFNGKATSADKLHTSPTINGVSFNGTANIITSRWGAERALKIGNKSRTVNGSANVTWTLAEIGAPQVASLSALPTSNVGPIVVSEVGEVWVWVSTAHFTGYRSPLCGRPVDGHTVTPLASEIDAVGGLVSKTAYAGLWGYAKENNLVVSQSVWADRIGSHLFVDVSNTQFRVPDLRNQFRRYTGTDADTENARALGSRQLDATQNITGNFQSVLFDGTGALANGAFSVSANAGSSYAHGTSGNMRKIDFDASNVARASSETRSANVAFYPRIHI